MLLHQSNCLEYLFAQLCRILEEPPADPLQPEIIVVQNQGMAQWVARQLALHTGIAANLHFPLPGRCVWDLLHRLGGAPAGEDLFQASLLHWRILARLPELLHHPAFAEPAAYLLGDDDQLRLYQLCGKIADAFDQYQVYRPDLLTAWQQGQDNHWQARLWRRLSEEGEAPRVGLAPRFSRLLDDAATAPASLPQRLHLFGLNALAPVYLEIFQQVGTRLPLHLYHLSPCLHYWGDLVSARRQAGLRARGQEVGAASYHDQGHPLLVSLGQTGQDFFRQLQDSDVQEVELYQPGEERHLLAVLQNDILELHDRSASGELRSSLDPDDRSIQLHCCFSPLREIQVLHDRLLDLFAADGELTPGDILVSAPDIGRYADAIAGVFGEAASSRRIPWSIADQSLAREQPQVRCFLDLLTLLESRFTAPEVLALCENPVLLARFGLDAALLPRLQAWVEEAGIRWGLDDEHRRELAVAGGATHSWRFGLDRLLLGYCMGSEQRTVADLLPYPHLAPGEAEALGNFVQLLDSLARWRHQLQAARPAQQWASDLLALVEAFFATEDEDAGLNLLEQTILQLRADCRLAGVESPLSFAVVRAHLQENLSQTSGGQPFLSGRVSFCNMVPMRSVPFKVICLLGLGDGDFPRSQRPPSFDLIAAQPRLGDRNRRQDDRYLFLEALLSAREVLYLSWVGRNLRDESVAPPSVVVCELRDYLDQSCVLPGREQQVVSAWLTTEHPMQPFSRRCFTGTGASASYNPAWLPAQQAEEAPPFLSALLAEPNERYRRVDLAQLERFWRHPVRFFVEERLGLKLHGDSTSLAESEPFQLDSLQRYQLRQETVVATLDAIPLAAHAAGLAGSGRLPQAGFGRLQMAQIEDEADALVRGVQPLLEDAREPLEIDCQIGEFHLSGWLHHLFAAGRVVWRPGRLRGSDLLAWWISHLCLNLLRPPGQDLHSHYCCWQRQQGGVGLRLMRLRPVPDPEPLLAQLLAAYWQGLSRPLPFFSESSRAWAEAKEATAADKAQAVWAGGFNHAGEGADAAYGYFYAAQTLPLSAEFIELAALFTPIFEYLEEDDAAA